MKRYTIAEIAEIAGGKVLYGDPEYLVSGYAIDSREAVPGEVFFAIKGAATDGHKFIPQVLEKGCNCLVVSDETKLPENVKTANVVLVDNALFALQELGKDYLATLPIKKIIGVTGSVGKTSTRDMMYYVASSKYKAAKNKKNYNSSTGIPLSILEFPEDTEIAVLEMGMDAPGEITELVGLAAPDIAIITSITQVNLMGLGTVENIFKAKMEITGKFGKENTLVVNATFPMLSEDRVKGEYALITVGDDSRSNYYVSDISDFGDEGINYIMHTKDKAYNISLPVAGAHNAYNATLAIAVGELIGISVEEAAGGLINAELTGKRLNISEHNGIKIIDDSYNACEISVKSAINTLIATKGERKVAILGDILGLEEFSEKAHRSIGKHACDSGVDLVIAIGGEARFIADEAKKYMGDERVMHYDKKEDFINQKDDILKSGDVILLKASRIMELEKISQAILEG